MLEISRFYGIVVRMYWDDHLPPHFHAFYGDSEALIDFQRVEIYAGHLPPRALNLVMEWTVLHRDELLNLWKAARRQDTLWKVEPLA